MEFNCKNCGIEFDHKLTMQQKKLGYKPKFCSTVCSKEKVVAVKRVYKRRKKLGKMSKEEKVFGSFLVPFFPDIEPQFQIPRYYHNYDFYIKEFNLLVEYDGVYWHSKKRNQIKDRKHEIEAKKQGYNITRVTDVEWKQFLKVNKITKDMLIKLFNYLAR